MEALLLDPQADYADHLIDLLWTRHGVRTVALHSSWRGRVMGAGYPAVSSQAVSANYMIAGRPLVEVAAMLRRRHDIVAVVPHHESTLLPLHELAQRLDLDWAQPAVIPMFRDKGRLKEHLRRADPSLRVNHTRVVTDARTARAFIEESGSARIVVKPNDGASNVDVAFFDAAVTEAELDAHIALVSGSALVEQYVDGEEYYIDGQVDAAGTVHVIAIGKYVRRSHLGKENVEVGCLTVRTTDPVFEPLAAYTRRVITATGLHRSPFHLEAKVDGDGPCLIEVAARLCGANGAFQDGRMHGFDVLGLALEHYLGEVSTPPPLDWDAYDEWVYGYVMGTSDRDGLICSVQGVAQVEAMPEFVAWFERPHAGKRVRRTLDLATHPWSAELRAHSVEQLHAARVRAESLITWDDRPGPLARVRGASAYTSEKLRALSSAPSMARRTSLRWR